MLKTSRSMDHLAANNNGQDMDHLHCLAKAEAFRRSLHFYIYIYDNASHDYVLKISFVTHGAVYVEGTCRQTVASIGSSSP